MLKKRTEEDWWSYEEQVEDENESDEADRVLDENDLTQLHMSTNFSKIS